MILKIFIPGAASCSMVRQKLPEAGAVVRSGTTAGLGAEEGLQGIRGGSEGREQTWLWVLASPQTPGPWRVAVLEAPADQK